MATSSLAAELYLKTSNTDPVSGDKLTYTASVTIQTTQNFDEKVYLNGDGWTNRVATSKDFSGSLESDYKVGDTLHTLIEGYGPEGANAGGTLYLTIYTNPAAVSPANKGYKFPIKITSLDRGFPADGVVSFSINFAGTGAPVAVAGAAP